MNQVMHHPRTSGAAFVMGLLLAALLFSVGIGFVVAKRKETKVAANEAAAVQNLAAAEAGAEDVLERLLADPSWRGTVAGTLPGGASYTATATTGVDGQVVVSSSGNAGTGNRSVEITVSPEVVAPPTAVEPPPPPPKPEPDASTVALWRCDSLTIVPGATTATAPDESINANHGTMTNMDPATDYVAGKFSQGLDFDGVDDHVVIPDALSLNPAAITVEAWVNPATTSSWRAIAGKKPKNGAGYLLAMTSFGKFVFNVHTAGKGEAYGTTAATVGNWYHVAGTYDGANVRLYVNGVLEATTAQTGAFANTLPLYAGRQEDATFYFWKGQLDEVRISNIARTFGGDPDTLALWHLDAVDAGGTPTTTVADASVNANDGGMRNMDPATDYVAGKFAECLDFDGADDYVVKGTVNGASTAAFTVEGWIKVRAYANNDRAFHLVNCVQLYEKTIQGVPSWGLFIPSSTSGTDVNLPKGSIKVGAWQHFAFVFDGAQWRIYLDGVKKVQGTMNPPASYGEFFLGTYNWWNNYLNGQLDEWRISSLARYTADFAPAAMAFVPDANTVLLWHMEGAGGASTTPDASANARTATLKNMDAATDLVAGKAGYTSCLDFDGTNDFLQVADAADLNPAAITVEAWVKPAALPTSQVIAAKRAAQNNGWVLALNQAGNAIFTVDTGSGSSATAASGMTIGTWYHVAGTYDGANARVYVNGVLGGTMAQSGSISNTEPIFMGCREGASGFFSGQLDEVRISSVARTTFNLLGPYAAGGAPAAPYDPDVNTAGLWHLEPQTGASTVTLPDATAAALDAACTGLDASDVVAGKFGNALDLDGATEYALRADAAVLNPTSAITAEAWVYPRAAGRTLFEKAGQYGLEIDATGKPVFRLTVAGIPKTVAGPDALGLNAWSHLAGTYDGRWIRLLVDGTTVAAVTASGSIASGTADLGIGTGSLGLLDGLLDEVRISGIVRVLDPDTVGLWHLDDTTGSVLDASYNGSNHGTALNGIIRGAPGHFASAFQCDGLDDEASVPDSAGLDLTSAVTVEAWVRPTAYGQKGIVTKGSAYLLKFDGTDAASYKPSFVLWIGGVQKTLVATQTAVLNEWHHYAGTYDGATLRIYIDGLEVGSLVAVGSIDASTNAVQIGRGIGVFAGSLDEVRISGKARTFQGAPTRAYGEEGLAEVDVVVWR